jgi:hypothetical protein
LSTYVSDEDRRQQKAKDELALKVLELDRQKDFLEIAGSASGRRFLYALIDDCGGFSLSYTGEALGTAFNEGRRSVAVRLLQRFQLHAPNEYVAMLVEHVREVEKVKGLEKK